MFSSEIEQVIMHMFRKIQNNTNNKSNNSQFANLSRKYQWLRQEFQYTEQFKKGLQNEEEIIEQLKKSSRIQTDFKHYQYCFDNLFSEEDINNIYEQFIFKNGKKSNKEKKEDLIQFLSFLSD